MTFWGVATTVGLVWWMLQPEGLFFALGAFASLIVSIPLARPHSSILSPWALVAAIHLRQLRRTRRRRLRRTGDPRTVGLAVPPPAARA